MTMPHERSRTILQTQDFLEQVLCAVFLLQKCKRREKATFAKIDPIAFSIMPCAIPSERPKRPELFAVSRYSGAGSTHIANGAFVGACHGGSPRIIIKKVRD